MANFNGSILTAKGRSLIDKSILRGFSIQLTNIKVGDGTWNNIIPEQLENLVNAIKTFNIDSVDFVGDGIVNVSFTVDNKDLYSGLTIKEIGIFANDPDEGEILFAVIYAENGDYLPTLGNSHEINVFNINVVIADASVESVTVEGLIITLNKLESIIEELTYINKPKIEDPSYILGSEYSTSKYFEGKFDGSEWEIYSDINLNNLVVSKTSTDNALKFDSIHSNLIAGNTYYVRVRYLSDKHKSLWSDVESITVPSGYIKTPELNTGTYYYYVPESFTVYGDAYAIYYSSEPHTGTTWSVKDSNGNEIWNKYSTVDKTQTTIPAGVLSDNKEYRIEAIYHSNSYSSKAGKLSIKTNFNMLPTSEYYQIAETKPHVINKLGKSLSANINGSLLIAGDPKYSDETGLVKVYKSNNYGVYEVKSVIYPELKRKYSNFGYDVHLNNTSGKLFISSPGISEDYSFGRVDVYTFNNGNPTYDTYIEFSNKRLGDFFGGSVSTSNDGNTLAIGAPGIEKVVVYTFTSGAWQESAVIDYPNYDSNSNFGYKVSLSDSGNVLAISANHADGDKINQGKVFIYVKESGSWIKKAELNPSEQTVDGYFGSSLSLNGSGNIIAIGSFNSFNGNVYIFEKNVSDGSWYLSTKLTDKNKYEQDFFGFSLDIKSNVLLIGDPYNSRAYLYEKIGNVWEYIRELKRTGDYVQWFGDSVFLTEDLHTAFVASANNNYISNNVNIIEVFK